MDVDDLPDEYWVVKSRGSVYYVDADTARTVREEYLKDKTVLIFTDLAGSQCWVPRDSLTDLFSSNIEIRDYEREFNKKLNEESERPSWE